MSESRLLGVTVMPEYIQSEGTNRVLDLLQRSGVNAVATSPYVMEPAEEGAGAREPPADAGAGDVRLLDRPLWGRRELWVRTAPSFSPRRELYDGGRYQPSEPTELTHREGGKVAEFIAAAKGRGMKVYLQVMAAIPPGYRVQFGGPADDDLPRLPDGRVPMHRVSNNGSLASPHIVDYTHSLIRDLLTEYPTLDGLRVDWPEYPPYRLDSVFVDFGGHAERAAERLGYDFALMKRDVGALYKVLHGGLTDEGLRKWPPGEAGRTMLLRWLGERPGMVQWMQFKAALSRQLLAGFRKVMNAAGGEQVALAPSAFPPPWSLVSGFNFGKNGRHVNEVAVKLYGMHWAMMLHFYAEQLLAANPDLSEPLAVRGLANLLDIADDGGSRRLDDYRYPGPDEPHPIGEDAQLRKIAQAQREAGACPVHVLAHGYGPLDDFRRRFEIALRAGPHGVWINRYAYLSDEKLAAVAELAGERSS